jgi:hypothetical protein
MIACWFSLEVAPMLTDEVIIQATVSCRSEIAD